ncbi:MAG: CapA family protein [Clostridia bacterium]|nr:CapA family protein [Clostridia bacterium]
MIKKFFAFSVALIMILSVISLASCGGKNEPVETKNPFDTLNFETVETRDTEPPETETEPIPVYKATFVGCGDNIVYTGTVWEATSQAYAGGRDYNFKPIYEDVADIISSADIAYINQECVMDGGAPAYYPQFNSPQDLGYDLVELGFDVINIANNHMLDRGGDGLSSTIEFWKGLDCVMIGGNRDRADYDNIEYIDANGIKIALLSFTEMTNGFVIGANYDVWVPYLDEQDIKDQCATAKSNGADLILCSVHWGDEYWGAGFPYEPNEKQQKWAKIMADAGVDVIIGTHPHVIQKIEYVKASDGREVLCAYSLGNFMAMQAYDHNMLGGIISFDINKVGDEHATVDNVLFTPTVYYFAQNWYGSRVIPLSDFTDALASSHGIRNYGNNISVDTLKYYLNCQIADEFLPEEFKTNK